MERQKEGKPTPPAQETLRNKYIPNYIPLDVINVLNQPRQTFEELDIMAQSIADHGLLNPLNVANFSKQGAEEYLRLINDLWAEEHTLDEIKPTVVNGEERYYVLIAGERRLRSCRKLDTEGCVIHPGVSCYALHNPEGDRGVRVSEAKDFPAFEIALIQTSENIHMAVPPHEQAHQYKRIWGVAKIKDPELTVEGFSRSVGKTADVVRTALRYCELPQEIQDRVARKEISYGIATQVARLRNEIGATDQELNWWVLRAIAHKYRVSDFTDKVSEAIRIAKSGQITMLDAFNNAQAEDLRRREFKKVVASEMIKEVWGIVNYLRRVRGLYQQGELGAKDSPYSIQSPLRVWKALIEEQRRLVPHLQDVMAERDYQESIEVMADLEFIISQLMGGERVDSEITLFERTALN